VSQSLVESEPYVDHYHTAGNALIIVGLINLVIAGYALLAGSENSFISYDNMLMFAVTFILLGGWMRSLTED